MFKQLLFFSVVAVSAFMLKITTNKIAEVRYEESKETETSSETVAKPRKVGRSKKSQQEFSRSPASVQAKPLVEEYSEKKYIEQEHPAENIVNEEVPEVVAESRTEDDVPKPQVYSNTSSSRPAATYSPQAPVANKSSTIAVASSVSRQSATYTGPITGATSNVPLSKPSTIVTPTDTTTGTTTTTTGSASVLTCTTNIAGGAYPNPISVAVNCSSNSSIKYCIGNNGSCCDPRTSGVSYTGNVVIGATNGAFCLGYYGTTATGKQSSVQYNSYTISSELPDLKAKVAKLFYQTTELSGSALMASNDFSKTGFGVGVINLKSHDPGPAGLDMTCDEIINKHSTLASPSSQVILSFFDTSGTLVTSQLNVPLVLNNLSYGENFITTFISNKNFAAPLNSCSTQKVTLEDFEYFEGNISHGEPGTNTVREFAGAFTPIGFFEEDSSLNREPAGGATEDLSGQTLETGLFGVIY